MGSLRHVFFRSQGAWGVGVATSDDSSDLYLDGGTWTNPDTRVLPSYGESTIAMRMAGGGIVGLAYGGAYAARPPEPEEP